LSATTASHAAITGVLADLDMQIASQEAEAQAAQAVAQRAAQIGSRWGIVPRKVAGHTGC